MKVLLENPMLKKKTNNVSIEKGRVIARRMIAFLLAKKKKIKALGLAANQVGLDASVAIVFIKHKPLILINPKIVKFSELKFCHKEGCLSFPDIQLDVYRHRWIEVEADNHKEKLFFGSYAENDDKELNLESAVVQHEIAHLSGLTFHDFQWNTSPTPDNW